MKIIGNIYVPLLWTVLSSPDFSHISLFIMTPILNIRTYIRLPLNTLITWAIKVHSSSELRKDNLIR